MFAYDQWKKGFDVWERSTAELFDVMLKSPLVLEPSGAMLSAMMRAKAAVDRNTARWWGLWGLPTKRDQERALHTLNELESRLMDLEERLEDMNEV